MDNKTSTPKSTVKMNDSSTVIVSLRKNNVDASVIADAFGISTRSVSAVVANFTRKAAAAK